MSIPVREMDSYGSAAALQLKKSNKISEQENLSSFGKAEINDSAREDTVKISQEACNITKEFGKTEEDSVVEQREQLRFKEEDWDRIEDERIEDRDVQNENERRSDLEMESLERVPESEQLEAEREEGSSEHNEEIIAAQEAKIEEENIIRDEEADAAKAFTASYINNPSSPGNIINVTA